MPGVELVPLRGIVEGLRAVKDPAEVALIRRALAIAGAGAGRRAPRRLAGKSEIAIASRIQAEIRRQGGDDESFPTIVASGPRAALSARPSDAKSHRWRRFGRN